MANFGWFLENKAYLDLYWVMDLYWIAIGGIVAENEISVVEVGSIFIDNKIMFSFCYAKFILLALQRVYKIYFHLCHKLPFYGTFHPKTA